MSGGVDSSTTAILLKEQGYNVIGATMSIWGKGGIYEQISKKHENNPKKPHGACLGPNEKEDIEAAEKICKQIGIPFYVFDCAKQYEEIVLKNFKKEYLEGRTPNPCILCNSLIKFDALPQLAKQTTSNLKNLQRVIMQELLKKITDIFFKKDVTPKKTNLTFYIA